MDFDSPFTTNIFETFTLTLCVGYHDMDVAMIVVVVDDAVGVVVVAAGGTIISLHIVVFVAVFNFKAFFMCSLFFCNNRWFAHTG